MVWRIALWFVAAAAVLLPRTGPFVDRWFSRGLFPWIQRALTTLSNLAPFALFDVLVAVLVLGVIAATLRDLTIRRDGDHRRHDPRRTPVWARLPIRLATVAAVAYLVFLAVWGLNYRRQPLTARIPYDAARVTAENARRLAAQSVSQVNALYAPAHGEPWPPADQVDPALAQAFMAAQPAFGREGPFVPARPKWSLLDLYFRRVGVAGMTDPYFLETLVASDLLVIERPMVVAHEWAHLAGLADEGEANFAGWLACLRGGALHRYSAWLFLYGEVVSDLPDDLARRIAEELDAGPRADLQAIRERILTQVNPTAAAAGWSMYDRYLKANRVDEGTRSYGQVTRLVLGSGAAGR